MGGKTRNKFDPKTPDGIIWYPAKKDDPIFRKECHVYDHKTFDETGAS